MAEPAFGVCADWVTDVDLCAPCNAYSVDASLLADMMTAASNILFRLTLGMFPGECVATVRPCAVSKKHDPWRDRSVMRTYDTSWGYCDCNRRSGCSCSGLSSIRLGYAPIISVSEVKVDGNVVSASLYRVDDYEWLTKLPNADGTIDPWPCCQRLDLASTEDETFEVTFTYGRNPPVEGVRAAGSLACELALACDPNLAGKCRLPKQVQSVARQGVNLVMLDPVQAGNIAKALPEVALFLDAYNPTGARSLPAVLSPDIGEPSRRLGT